MANNEKSSPKLAKLASRALKAPSSLNAAEVKSLAASVLTQAPDRKPAKTKKG